MEKRFSDAGITINSYNLSFTAKKIDRGLEFAKGIGAKYITASSTLSTAKRVAPFAKEHQTIADVHGHSREYKAGQKTFDPNQFSTPESFAKAFAMSKYFWVNLDIGHFTAADCDAVAYIRENHSRIRNIHLKDPKKDEGANMPFGKGDTPMNQVLQHIKESRKMAMAELSDRRKWKKLRVRRLMRKSELSQKAVYAILAGEPVRPQTLATIKRAADDLPA